MHDTKDAPDCESGDTPKASNVDDSTLPDWLTEENTRAEFRRGQVTQHEFLVVVFGDDVNDAHVCVFTEDPANLKGGGRKVWGGGHYGRIHSRLMNGGNQYFTISTFEPSEEVLDSGEMVIRDRRRISLFKKNYVIVVDDVGVKGGDNSAKVDIADKRLPPPSYALQTSPGNWQYGYLLIKPETNGDRVDNLINGMVAKGIAEDSRDPGMKGLTRYVRLPGNQNPARPAQGVPATNNKQKYVDVLGKPYDVELSHWDPDTRYTIDDLAKCFDIDVSAPVATTAHGIAVDDEEHPALVAYAAQFGVKERLAPGKYDATCPNVLEHTDGVDDGAAIFLHETGRIGIKCWHGHCNGDEGDVLTGNDVMNMMFDNDSTLRERVNAYSVNNMFGGPISESLPAGVSGGAPQTAVNKTNPFIKSEGGQDDVVPVIPEVFVLPNSQCSYMESGEFIFKSIATHRKLFTRPAGGVVRLSHCRAEVEEMTPVMFQSAIESFCGATRRWFFNTKSGGSGEWELKPTRTKKDEASVLLSSDQAREHLPKLKALIGCPVITAEGKILDKGYHSDNGGILITNGANIPVVSVIEATGALKNLLMDFKFKTEGDKSRAVAMMITPALKHGGLVPPITPIDIAEADKSQAGKTYRQKLNAAIYYSTQQVVTDKKGSGVGSLDESLAEKFRKGDSFIQMDNLRGRLDSQFLEAAITSPERVTCRVPHLKDVVVDISTVTISLTSNGVNITRDLANRSCVSRIEKRDPGEPFTLWGGVELLEHVRRQQGYYLGCVFAIIKDWLMLGMPKTLDVDHDMKTWAQPVDWIVQNIFKMPPITAGYSDIKSMVSNPVMTWLRQICIEAKLQGRVNLILQAHDILALISAGQVPWAGAIRVPEDDESANMAIGRNMATLFLDAVPGENNTDVLDIDGFRVMRMKSQEYDDRQRLREMKKYLIEVLP